MTFCLYHNYHFILLHWLVVRLGYLSHVYCIMIIKNYQYV